jgi:hypothetical protein
MLHIVSDVTRRGNALTNRQWLVLTPLGARSVPDWGVLECCVPEIVKCDEARECAVNLTGETVTIEITVDAVWYYDVFWYREERRDSISGLAPGPYLRRTRGRSLPTRCRDDFQGTIGIDEAGRILSGRRSSPAAEADGSSSGILTQQDSIRGTSRS